MTAIDCMLIGLLMVALGFLFGITGSIITKKFSVQDKFYDVGGWLVGAGAVIAMLSWIYYVGTIIL